MPCAELDSRAKGYQFTTNRQKGGQTGDNWNRKHGRRTDFVRAFEGEEHLDPHTHERKWKLEQKKKNLTPEGFKYSSPNKKSSCLGGNSGLFSSFTHEPDFEVEKKGEVPTRRDPALRQVRGHPTHTATARARALAPTSWPALPHLSPWCAQVVTSPSKKGYGASTPGTQFGPGPRKGEAPKIGKEYEHSPDPYDLARQYERAERAFNKERLASRPAYKTMSHSLDFFDGYKSVASRKILEPQEQPEKPATPAAEAGKAISETPFYPAQGPRSGPLGTFSKFPEYIEDPEDAKMKAAREAAAEAKITGGAWRPTYSNKSTPMKTIVFREAGIVPDNVM